MMPSFAPTMSQRKGMTLVELVVSIALSAMLLVALTGVLQGISRQAKLADGMDDTVWPRAVSELFRRDLIAADAIWKESGLIWMRTDAPVYHAADDRDLGSIGLRRIGYRCIRLNREDAVLIRIDSGRRTVLAIGPTKIVVERLDADGVPQPLPPLPGPVPAQVRLWVWESTDEAPVIISDLVTR